MWDLMMLALGVVIGLLIGNASAKGGSKQGDGNGSGKDRVKQLTLLPPHQPDDRHEGSLGKFARTPLNNVKRLPARGNYDKKEVYATLDSQVLCNVGFVDHVDGNATPVIIPMLFGRKDDKLFLHGHVSSGVHQKLRDGVDCCIAVASLDGLVYAHSLFHSSVNYRSVVCFGKARSVTDKEQQMEALATIVRHSQPGRWDDARLPNTVEMVSTGVIEVDIYTASAKCRAGPSSDDKEDEEKAANWAGVLPVYQVIGEPSTAAHLPASYPVPFYVENHSKFYRIQK